MVPSPGTTPCSASFATRRVSSLLIAAAVALPSRIFAVTRQESATHGCRSADQAVDGGVAHGGGGVVRRDPGLDLTGRGGGATLPETTALAAGDVVGDLAFGNVLLELGQRGCVVGAAPAADADH